jgi:hypothetical protein
MTLTNKNKEEKQQKQTNKTNYWRKELGGVGYAFFKPKLSQKLYNPQEQIMQKSMLRALRKKYHKAKTSSNYNLNYHT